MNKKLFSFFITSFVFISGVAILPGGVDALTQMPFIVLPEVNCQIGGIVEKAFFFENTSPDGQPSGYYLDIYMVQSESLSVSAGSSYCPKKELRRQFFFLLDMLPTGITASLLENRFIDFIIDDNSNNIDSVITEKEVISSCSIEGETLHTIPLIFPTTPVMCGEEYNRPCGLRQVWIPIKITNISSSTQGQCNSGFTIGQEKSFPVASINNPRNKIELLSGEKVIIQGELTTRGFYPRSASISETPKPKPEEPKNEPETKEENNEKQQDELTPVLDTSTPPQQTQSDNSLLLGILIGLLVGLGAVVVTYLVKRKK